MAKRSRVFGSCSVGRRPHQRDEDSSAYIAMCRARVLVPAMLLGGFVGLGLTDAEAQEPDLPHACKLNQDTIESLKGDITSGPSRIESPEVSFIVVYRLNTNNWGQPIEGGGTTAPVICTDPDLDLIDVTEANDIPSEPNESVDILNADDMSAVRIQEKTSGIFATRICLSSKAIDSAPVTCYIIKAMR